MPREQSVSKDTGFSSVETLLAASVFALLVTALAGVYLYGEESTALSGNRARATMLAEEGLEAVRNIRDAAFSNLANGTHGLTTAGNQWSLSGASDISDIFTRAVTISSIDPNRKSISSNVIWQQNLQRTGNVVLTTYLTNWQRLVLGNWSNPIQIASVNFFGNNDGMKIQVAGDYAYVVRNGGTPDFGVVDVSNPASPALIGTISLVGNPQNIYVSGNYAYVASDDNNQEIQIINVSNPALPSVVGTYNLPGAANARGVFVNGTSAYYTRGNSVENEFAVVDVTIPTAPLLVGSLNLNADGNEVIASGNYAYVASSDNSQELKVVNIATSTAPSLASSLDFSGIANAITVALAGPVVFIGQGNTLQSVDVTSPTAPSILDSFGTLETLNDIALNLGRGDTHLFLATSDNSSEFKVVDVTTPSALSLIGSVNTTGNDNLNGVAYDEARDRAFVVGDANSAEFQVIAPQ